MTRRKLVQFQIFRVELFKIYLVITRGIANQISQVACILLYLISIFYTSVIRNGDYSLTFQSSYYKCYPILMLVLLLLSTHSSFGMHTGLLISRVGFRMLSSMSQNLSTLNRSKSNPLRPILSLYWILCGYISMQ